MIIAGKGDLEEFLVSSNTHSSAQTLLACMVVCMMCNVWMQTTAVISIHNTTSANVRCSAYASSNC
jgi:hypothetical protein